MGNKKTAKRGVSPVIATVLLIGIVIVLSVIIFLWARAFVAEKAEKFGRAVELSCDEVNFEAGIFLSPAPCDDYTLDIVNRGDVPIYGFEVKDFTNPGTVKLSTVVEQGTITIGKTATFCLTQANVQPEEQLLVVPKILGETDTGKVAHTCTDNFGYLVGVPPLP